MAVRKIPIHPFLVAALALGGLAFAPSGAVADEAPGRSLIVARGSGEVRVRPDSVHVDAGVEAQAASLDEARTQVDAGMARVVEALKALDLPELTLETHTIRFSPVYAASKDGRSPAIAGYTASNHVIVTVKHVADADLAARTAKVVDTALDAGANSLGSIEFFLADPAEAEDEALTHAVEAAQHDAETIATAAHVTLVGLASAEESAASRAPRSFELEVARISTPVSVGDITIESNVTAKFWFR